MRAEALAKNMPTTRYRRWTNTFYNLGGRHGCYPHNGMGRFGQYVSSNFHPTHRLYFHTPADRLDSLRRPTHGHRHDPRWRSGRAPGTRCVSSFLPRCGLGYAGPLATVGSGAGPTFLSTGYGGRRLGRHLVSSVRQKGQGCRLVARCGPFDRRHHRLCLGSQYRGC